MRITYLTDLHGDLKSFLKLIKKVFSDLIILGGDIAGFSIKDEGLYYEFCEIQRLIKSKTDDLPYHYAKKMRKVEKNNMVYERYIELVKIVKRDMKRFYRLLKGVIKRYSRARYFYILPGNYDINLSGSPLAKWNLHRRVVRINGIKIAGYGGASVFTEGVPDVLRVKYGDEDDIYRFLVKNKPDILVLHNPPYGIMDKVFRIGNIGNRVIRELIDSGLLSPKLVLMGHIHEFQGIEIINDTVFLNPSNFGYIPSLGKMELDGGFFANIDFDTKKKSLVRIDIMKLDRISGEISFVDTYEFNN